MISVVFRSTRKCGCSSSVRGSLRSASLKLQKLFEAEGLPEDVQRSDKGSAETRKGPRLISDGNQESVTIRAMIADRTAELTVDAANLLQPIGNPPVCSGKSADSSLSLDNYLRPTWEGDLFRPCYGETHSLSPVPPI